MPTWFQATQNRQGEKKAGHVALLSVEGTAHKELPGELGESVKQGIFVYKVGLYSWVAQCSKVGDTEFHRFYFWAKCTR